MESELFPVAPLPAQQSMIAWKIDMRVGTLAVRAQQLANAGNANGRCCIARHFPLPRGIAFGTAGILAACQLVDYTVQAIKIDKDRVVEHHSQNNVAIDSRTESAIVLPPGCIARMSHAQPSRTRGNNWSYWEAQDTMDVDSEEIEDWH